MGLSQTTRRWFARSCMTSLGIKDNLAHRGTRRFLEGAWPHAETGERPGICNGIPGEGARWNPFNTTLVHGGSHAYLNVDGSPNTAGVQNYPTRQAGAEAFMLTLAGDERYAPFVALLRKRGTTQRQLAVALAKSPWFSSKGADQARYLALLDVSITAYMSDRRFYNTYPIGS